MNFCWEQNGHRDAAAATAGRPQTEPHAIIRKSKNPVRHAAAIAVAGTALW